MCQRKLDMREGSLLDQAIRLCSPGFDWFRGAGLLCKPSKVTFRLRNCEASVSEEIRNRGKKSSRIAGLADYSSGTESGAVRLCLLNPI